MLKSRLNKIGQSQLKIILIKYYTSLRGLQVWYTSNIHSISVKC